MIVLVDQEHMTVTICDKEVITYNWSDIENISSYIEHQDVIYVSEAQIVPGSSVVQLVRDALGRDYKSNTIKSKKSGRKYYHATTNGQLVIQSNNDKEDTVFRSITDFRTVESMPEHVVNSEPFRIYMKLGKIEIVDEITKIKIEKDMLNKRSKFVTKEDSIDRIIVKSDERGTAERVASGDFSSSVDDIAENIDLSNDFEI